MLNYHIQELPDLHEGEEKLFPKLTTYSQFAGRKMRRIAMEAGVHEGVVMATLDALPRALKSTLPEGHTCKIDSLTGVSRSTASRELKQITSHPEWGIITEGQGNRKVWVHKR